VKRIKLADLIEEVSSWAELEANISSLPADRVKRLEEIGFLWGEERHRKLKPWDLWYGLTLKYKEQTGDANALRSYKTPAGFNLGIWQSHQRKNYKKGILSEDKIKRLEDIGFVWAPQKGSL